MSTEKIEIVKKTEARIRRKYAIEILSTLPQGFTKNDAAMAFDYGDWHGLHLHKRFVRPDTFLKELISQGLLEVRKEIRADQETLRTMNHYYWVGKDGDAPTLG